MRKETNFNSGTSIYYKSTTNEKFIGEINIIFKALGLKKVVENSREFHDIYQAPLNSSSVGWNYFHRETLLFWLWGFLKCEGEEWEKN